MQTTNDLYRQIYETPGHIKQHKVVVSGVEYWQDKIVSLRVSGGLFVKNGPSVGGTVARQIDLTLRSPGKIPRMASIRPYTRLVYGSQSTDWLPKGLFYIDTRAYDPQNDLLTIHGYDDMLKFEQTYLLESDTGTWPRSAKIVAQDVASRIGITLDERCSFSPAYQVPYSGDYTMRELLSHIAIANTGNWTITDAGKLRLVRLADLAAEESYLVDEYGYAISFGGDLILV